MVVVKDVDDNPKSYDRNNEYVYYMEGRKQKLGEEDIPT